ncbi:MAG: hypothetical protein P0S96_03660 [Simkaniaceae bacterium]|nr:hypothetical protein [Candidatus Sacchlamyda saccharinae]
MQTASYARSLHNSTAFTQVDQNDGIATRAWKLPAGCVANTAVTVFALAEALFFSLATVVFSPLYLFSNDRFHPLVADAKDSAKTAAHAAGRIFGFGSIEIKQPAQKLLPAPNPATLTDRVTTLAKRGANIIRNTALKNPNTTLALIAVAVAASAAYYFGLFDHAASLIQSPTSPVVENGICLPAPTSPWTNATAASNPLAYTPPSTPEVAAPLALWSPAAKTAKAATSLLPDMDWAKFYPAQAPTTPAPIQVAPAVIENGICLPAPTTPWTNATAVSDTFSFTPPPTVEDRLALWSPAAMTKEAATKSLPDMNWAKLYQTPTVAASTPATPTARLMIAPPAAPNQPLFPLNTNNWMGWLAKKLNTTN